MRNPSRPNAVAVRHAAAPRFHPPPGVTLRLGRAGLELVDADGVPLPAFRQGLLLTGVSSTERRALRAQLLKQAQPADAAEAPASNGLPLGASAP